MYPTISSYDLRDGDQIFQNNKFSIKDINTYLSRVIYFGINFWNWIKKRPICPVHHCGTIFRENGQWYVYEAKSQGYVRTNLSDKFNNKNITLLLIKRYDLKLNQVLIMHTKARFLLNTDYDFISLFKHFFTQLFDQKIDLEHRYYNHKIGDINCSEANGILLHEAGIEFRNPKSLDPEDLWKDSRSIIIGKLK